MRKGRHFISWGRLAWLLPAAIAAAGFALQAGCSGNPGTAQAPPPLATILKQAATAAAGGPVTISYKTSDGWTIVGDLYRPMHPSKEAVLLLHERGGSGQDWSELCRALATAGITALAIDQRGAGRSTSGPGGTGSNAPRRTSGDIAAAVAQLARYGAMGLCGASYGANNALIYAAAHPRQIRSVVLYSPGANYFGLLTLAPARRSHFPVLIFHGAADGIADGGPQEIYSNLPGRDKTLKILPGGKHGTALLSRQTIEETTSFFRRTLK
ncbi:MAG TPA: alpha/beta fold hydrolase [Chthonomonadales bacterium]|nr:alpha/beta fold hydrolase [Chthonomonadales bacterium]